ncbi:DUF5133 domain-containing protein [Streptomyces hebeiensis]
MLLPDRHLVDDLLGRYRSWERLVLADPLDEPTRRRFEDVAYTLCVLMGQRTAREAIWQAETYLRRTGPEPATSERTAPESPAPEPIAPEPNAPGPAASRGAEPVAPGVRDER